MNWKTRQPRFPDPVVGDERYRRIFALLPRECTDGITRWLEPVILREVYRGPFGFTLWSYWEELCAKSIDKPKEPEDAKPHIYSYKFINSKENPVDPKPDYEGAVVYRYEPSTHQHIPIGTLRGGKIIPEVALKLGEWHEYDSSGTIDCGNETGSYKFDSWRDPVPVGPIEIGAPKFDLTEELIKSGTGITRWGWNTIEGCESPSVIAKARASLDFETRDYIPDEWRDITADVLDAAKAVREGRIAEHADEQYPALRGSGRSTSGEVKRQTAPDGNKETARPKARTRKPRAKKS